MKPGRSREAFGVFGIREIKVAGQDRRQEIEKTDIFSFARWIGRNAGAVAPGRSALRTDEETEALAGTLPSEEASTRYRKDFTVREGLCSATLSISGLGYYDAAINGVRPDERRVLSPIPSDYYLKARYDTYDVTAFLHTGMNTLAAEVCCGWFAPNEKWWTSWQMTWYATPRMIAQLTLVYEDGSTETVVTDKSWMWAEGPVLKSCVYDGEIVDFNKDQDGWDRPGFTAAGWHNAVEVESVTDIILSVFCVKSLGLRAKRIIRDHFPQDQSKYGSDMPRKRMNTYSSPLNFGRSFVWKSIENVPAGNPFPTDAVALSAG